MRIGVIIILLLSFKIAFGQNNHLLEVVPSDKQADFFKKKFSYKAHLKDSVEAADEAGDLLHKLRSSGYAAASIDSILADSTKTYTYIYVGEKLGNIVLQNGNIDERLLGDAGVKSSILSGKAIRLEEAEVVQQKLIRHCENTGYPFASTRLDSFKQHGDYFSATVFLEKHDAIRYDSLHIVGKTKVKRIFLRNYLGLKTGKPYNESTIRRINQRLSELQFVEPLRQHNVEFANDKAKVNLFLKDKKSSQFDLLIGFLPGSSGKKLLVTGDVLLNLLSPFGLGEEFYLRWQKLQPKTQTLRVKVAYPYLIGLPLGISASFDLYKRDTSFVDINGDYGVQYQLAGSNYLKASYRQKLTIITNVDTTFIKQNRKLPLNMDVSANEFALEYFFQQLDYRFNPTTGWVVTLGGSAGVKAIRKNNNITGLYDELNGKYFSYLYDTMKLKTFQFRLALAIDKYWRLAPRHTIKTSIEGKYLYSRNIFENEKYRIGGVNSLRGFDDQSIFSPYYAMANVEYRFLLSKNSYFSTFFNAAMVQDARIGVKPVDFPYGFGATAAVETKAGIFGLTYAMGTQLGNKLSLKSAKFHLGYVNYF